MRTGLRRFAIGGTVAALLMGLGVACGRQPTGGCDPGLEVAYPLEVAPGKRYLVGQDGCPFLMVGDSVWSLIVQLNEEDTEVYLDDRQEKGFNAIMVNVLEHEFADDAPENRAGELPFTTPGDFGAPNDAYFDHVDWVVEQAAERGILVMLVPAYLGFGGGGQGWYQEMQASGVDKLREYGRFLGRRYHDDPNILWVMGGDYNPPEKDLVRSVVEGIQEFDENHLFTVHAGVTNAAAYWQGESWLDVNNVYSYSEALYEEGYKEYDRQPTMPFFLLESTYENSHNVSAMQIRAQAYFALFSGAMGQLYGNNPMWHFDGPGLQATDVTWQEALDSQGANDMARLGTLFESLAWQKLVPDQDNTFLTDGMGPKGLAHALAAVAEDGSFALVYVPTTRAITLDLAEMNGAEVAASWFDPTSGETVADQGSPLEAGSPQELTPPGLNSTGDRDWLLILEPAG